MDYSLIVEYYEKLESTTSKLKKTEILADALKKTPADLLPKVVLLFKGRVFPTFEQKELGIATQMMIKAISKASGFKQAEVEKIFTKTGDLGLTAEKCLKKRKQETLFRKKLTVEFVFNNLRKLATITGEGSQEKKLNLIAELLVSSKPKEARYIVRTILEELRVGAAEGIIRDAIVQAFLLKEGHTKKDKEKATEAVNYAWNVLSDFGEVAKIAKEKGISGLKKVKIQIGKPIQVMLGLAAKNIESVVKEFGKIIAEWKYDGMRTQIHKKGNKIWVFTRRLEDVTKQFPDIVELCKKGLKAEECIVEGESIGIDTKTGMPIPFQKLGQRIHRKYDIEKMVKEIPVQVNLFDIVYLNGKMLLDKPLKERRKILEKVVKVIPEKFQLTKMIFTDDVKKLEKFYQEALDAKQEGLMLKVPDAKYTFGRHVGTMYKIKPIMETLDCVIVGAMWGEGARAKWLTSYELAVRDPDTGKFLRCGKLSTGLTEEEYKTMTKALKKLIVSEKGKKVEVRPSIVIEAGYQEIQKSPNYESGFALRFPRFIRLREDKNADEADTIERLKALYKSQGRAG
jgi:DNA ligase-1